MSHRFARNGWPRAAEIAAVATLTSGGSAHTEGAYTQLLASTAQNVCGLLLRGNATVSQSGVDTSMLATLAIGAAASEVDVVSNLNFSGYAAREHIWLPLRIPAGTRVAAKLRAELVSDTFDAQVCFLYNSQPPAWGGYAACETFGASTANSRGTAISNTAGTYTEITASTTNPLRAFNITCGLVDATADNTIHTVDIAVGVAGSEVIIGTWMWETAGEQLIPRLGPPFLEVPIPTGSRIAVKKNTTTDLSVCVHGWR